MAVHTEQAQGMEIRQAAAEALATRLRNVADDLVRNGVRPKRMPYGPPRAAGFGKRRSPKGFVLHVAGPRLQVLLPDGRLWQYHERRNIEGIYYDARTDHARAMHGTIQLNAARFSYLGAAIGKYHFGYRDGGDAASADGTELGAIVSRGGTTASYVEAGEAFAEIIRSL